ncbi:hypothetical protein G9A89_010919 [Geosiphon pyriformis]|nr:hypothetical protein G9A89_010919 [Geosiphon pyriformis]
MFTYPLFFRTPHITEILKRNLTINPLPQKLALPSNEIQENISAASFAKLAYCLEESSDDELAPGILGHAEISQDGPRGPNINVYIRGYIYSFEQWIKRQSKLIPLKGYPHKIKVDNLFYGQWKLAFDNIKRKILKVLKLYPAETTDKVRLNFIGHGLGAVHAVFTALELYKNLPMVEFQVFTFGQPRMGNLEFANLINLMSRENVRVYRMTHTDDFVPRLPPKKGGKQFIHHTLELWISNDCDDCDPSGFPVVYGCRGRIIDFQSGYINESKDCNNQYQDLVDTTAHNGPYFGYTMGFC